jgi:hypothetical protein
MMDAKRSLRPHDDAQHASMTEARRLSNAAREELSDVRLLLESASHNLQAILRGTPGQIEDLDQALENAHQQIGQVLSTLERVRSQRGRRA